MIVREMIGERGRDRSLMVICGLLGYTRQAYHKKRQREEREALKTELVIQEVLRLRETLKRVGARKLHHMLTDFLIEHEIEMGRDRLFGILREHSLLVRRRPSRKPRTTFSSPWKRYPNLIRELMRQGEPTKANQIWVSDITYVRLEKGFGYLSLITDAYSRKIVGYHLSRDLSAAGCVKALRMALRDNTDRAGLIHHSDRGLQYNSSRYIELLDKVLISMTENSDPLENAIAERVNGILKQELLKKRFENFGEARTNIDEAVHIYNNLRPHLSIDMLTPTEAHSRSGTLKRHWKNYFSNRPSTQAAAYAAA